jgi:hypothetical protein
MDNILSGWIEYEEEVRKFQLFFDENGKFKSAWISGELLDDIDSLSTFYDFYDTIYYDTLEHYREYEPLDLKSDIRNKFGNQDE